MLNNPDLVKCVCPEWHHLITPIINKCNEENVKILQVKEKFNELRIYVDGGSDELHKMIDAATASSCL